MKLNNKASFRAYIDESGDEGFVFRNDGSGSSRWFVISALVGRVKDDLQVVNCLKKRENFFVNPLSMLYISLTSGTSKESLMCVVWDHFPCARFPS